MKKQIGKETQFNKRQSGNLNDKPPIQLNQKTKEELDLTQAEKNQVVESLLEKSKVELIELRDNPSTPVFIISIINAILSDIPKGSIETLKNLLNGLYGNPKQGSNVLVRLKQSV